MSESKITKAPWLLQPSDGAMKWPSIITEKGEVVACVCAEPDAQAIAALPDLIEALKQVIAISDRKHDAWDRAKEALKKAGVL